VTVPLRDTARAMSRENVEVVLAVYAAWNAGDMDAVREMHHPDVILRTLPEWPEAGPWVGRETVMRGFEQMRDVFEADYLEMVSHSIDVGDRVAVRVIWHGGGQGPQADLELTGVYTVRKGRVVYQEFFWDHAEALETLGLSEQDAHVDS
jgi:ketosteroid isomerase-like protein